MPNIREQFSEADYNTPIDPYFLCPFSKKLMRDPVTISTGITYDRQSLLLITEGSVLQSTCVVTNQPFYITDCNNQTDKIIAQLIKDFAEAQQNSSLIIYNDNTAQYFICPISKKLMRDPVTVSTGITYDRNSLSELAEENPDRQFLQCPGSEQFFPTSDMLRQTHKIIKQLIDDFVLATETANERLSAPKMIRSVSCDYFFGNNYRRASDDVKPSDNSNKLI
jgi:hypothetical protein